MIAAPSKEWLEQKYIAEDLTTRDIAQIFSCSRGPVLRWLKMYGIDARPNHKRRFDMEHHPGWKGGVKKHRSGYIYIKAPNHPAANAEGYVKRSRLVAEKKLGRFLLPGEVVHHINEVKTDDSPDNLEVYPNQAAHLAIHSGQLQKARWEKNNVPN